ncbi:MAG: hypothetical protein LWW82_00845, partial [Comamonadaceae bacterium]|nr:hypothetical protein [Comamonadaceae bacterium]
KALLQAPSAEEHQAMAGNDPRRHVTFDVPGDGKFKVLNTPEHLQAFRKKVAQSPGFSSKGQKQAAPERNPGVQNGSSTKAAALNAMIEEGDFEAARDYAKAAGLSLDDAKPTGERKAQWAQYRKDGTVPAQPDTTPKEPSGYRLPDDVNKDWRDSAGRSSEHPDYVPTARQQLLMDAVGRAVDGGKFYAHDVNDAVANELGVTPEQRGRNRHNVDGGDFGYDAYMARNALDAQRGNAKSREIAKALSLQPGDKLGTLVFNDGKVTTGVAVTALSDTGLIATIAGKRGVATTHGQVGVDAIAAALDRAKERGKRKDGFAEFVAGRKQADANLNSAAVAEDTAMPGGQPQAATESGAQAEQPTDFIPAPDGGLDYGEITPEMGQAIRRQAGKIRLQQGNERFGLTHIESRHGEEIRNAGFASVQEFVADIAKNIDQVWKPDATSQLVALHVVKNDRVMFVQLQSESSGGQDFYTVNTAFPSRAGYVANKKNWKMLWEGRAQPSQSATSEQTPFAAPPQKAGEAATIPSGQSNASVAQISPQAQSSKPAESFTLSIRGFGDITMQVLNAVPTNPGETVVSERIIPANTRLSRADAEVLGLPADIKKVQAWRVSVIRSKDGKHGSLIEAM